MLAAPSEHLQILTICAFADPEVPVVAAGEGDADGARAALARSRDRKRNVGTHDEGRDGLADEAAGSRLGHSGGDRARRRWSGTGGAAGGGGR